MSRELLDWTRFHPGEPRADSTPESGPPLDDNTIRLAHQIQAFIRTGHTYAARIDDEIRALGLGISTRYPRPPDLEFVTNRGQRGGIVSNDSRLINFLRPGPYRGQTYGTTYDGSVQELSHFVLLHSTRILIRPSSPPCLQIRTEGLLLAALKETPKVETPVRLLMMSPYDGPRVHPIEPSPEPHQTARMSNDQIATQVAQILQAGSQNQGPPGSPGPPGPPGGTSSTNGNGNGNGWRPDAAGFFDPLLPETSRTPAGDIISIRIHLLHHSRLPG